MRRIRFGIRQYQQIIHDNINFQESSPLLTTMEATMVMLSFVMELVQQVQQFQAPLRPWQPDLALAEELVVWELQPESTHIRTKKASQQ
jgi:hypothetical protein